jgi:uncharacterized RDD family membrane protein YckC
MNTTCPSCNATNRSSAPWCGQCGVSFAMGAPGPAPVPSQPTIGPLAPGGGSWDHEPLPPAVQQALFVGRLAGVGRRRLARILDNIVIGILLASVELLLGLGEDLTGFLVWITLAVAFETAMLAGLGATPGKLALGLRVTGADGGRPTVGAAAIRSLVYQLLAIVPLILLLAAVAMERDQRRQGWHDHAANTAVLRASAGA